MQPHSQDCQAAETIVIDLSGLEATFPGRFYLVSAVALGWHDDMNSKPNHLLANLKPGSHTRGQGLVEFALITPFLLIFVLGVIEVGHLLAVYSGASGAARQAARYGAVAGDNGQGTVFYLDCAGIRATAKRAAFLQTLTDTNIQIAYDTGFITSTIGTCDTNGVPRFSDGSQMTSSNSAMLVNNGRMVVSVNTTYQPVTPLVPIPTMPINFVAARTIFTAIMGPTNTPVAPPDVSVSVQPNTVAPGSTFTQTITVNNSGPGVASSVTVTETVPAGLNYQSASGTSWNCDEDSDLVTCTTPYLAPSAPSVINVVLQAPTPGTYTSTVGVDAAQGDFNTSNNTVTAPTVVTTAPELGVSQAASSNPVTTNDNLTYSILVSNNGSATATSLRLTDTLPAGVTLVSFDNVAVGWSCSPSFPNSVICTRGSLVTGTPSMLTIGVTAPAAEGVITNTVTVSSAEADPIPSNNSSSLETTVVAPPPGPTETDLAVTQTDTPDPVGMNDLFSYMIQVTNNGPAMTTSVRVTDTLPGGTTYVSSWGTDWTCAPSGGTVVCTLAVPLGVGAASDVMITLRAPGASATLTNNVVVGSAVNDSNPSNNSATQTTTVLGCNPNVVSASHSVVSASTPLVQADGTETSSVLVTVRDSCGNLLSNQFVTLASSRGATDTITPASGMTNASGQFTFLVSSATASVYTGGAFTPSNFTVTAGGVTLTQQANVAFACMTGALAPFSGTQDLKFAYNNYTGINRRLVSLTLTWPSGSGRKMTSVNLQGVAIWSGNFNKSPDTINSGDWSGTSADRTINAGAGKTMQLNFNFPTAGTGTYTLTTVWDNGSGGSLCTALPIVVNR
jgi:uncharacterized repeat protein (TIGR01451 family)